MKFEYIEVKQVCNSDKSIKYTCESIDNNKTVHLRKEDNTSGLVVDQIFIEAEAFESFKTMINKFDPITSISISKPTDTIDIGYTVGSDSKFTEHDFIEIYARELRKFIQAIDGADNLYKKMVNKVNPLSKLGFKLFEPYSIRCEEYEDFTKWYSAQSYNKNKNEWFIKVYNFLLPADRKRVKLIPCGDHWYSFMISGKCAVPQSDVLSVKTVKKKNIKVTKPIKKTTKLPRK